MYSDHVIKIEKKWQDYWEKNKSFQAFNPGEKGSEKEKFYGLVMFPYPSGDGLHVGHPASYTGMDILCRYQRMRGLNVLQPMGWDAFGLPAEQFAIQRGIHPAVSTQKNIATFKGQLKKLGYSYDWDREIDTTDPKYVRWTQWLFKRLFERGLAYEKEGLVNWCPALGTVLANDEIIDGKSERGGHPVERRPMRQWYLKITEYAERLLNDLDTVDWPEATKEMQRNWIGKSVGAEVKFALADCPQSLEIFTTRPDTLMGVTFMVVAPEHPLLEKITSASQRQAVQDYAQQAARKSDLQRTDLSKGKSGIFTGGYALHPLNGEKIPIWVADYVLMTYGTGAIMAVPAHDERDKEFAEVFSLPIKPVIDEHGKLINSDFADYKINSLPYQEAAQKIISILESKQTGKKSIQYRLRDWAFSRQRYWGEPFPLVHVQEGKNKGKIVLIPDQELPLKLPEVKSYAPSGTGESPLAAIQEWMEAKDPETGARALRESNTMPGSAASSWYHLRYMDALNDNEAWSSKAEKYWGKVDLYLGGSEHAVGHLLYVRFWHKVFFDMGLVSHQEPFQKLVHQGMILGEDNEKMSKSRGNVVNPDDVIREYGADILRLFVMFLGPIEKSKPWQTKGIEGVLRFLSRYWTLCVEEKDAHYSLSSKLQNIPQAQWPKELLQLYHKTIKQVGDDILHLRMNTAISAMMILVNECYVHLDKDKKLPLELLQGLTKILSPFAPHLCEEVWEVFGKKTSLAREAWPEFDPALCVNDEIELPIQINGKLRDKVLVSKEISQEELKKLVLEREAIVKWMEGKPLKKFIYVKGRMASIVV